MRTRKMLGRRNGKEYLDHLPAEAGTTAPKWPHQDFLLFLSAAAGLGIMSGIYDNTFNNYLADLYHISEQARGFLEFPRELPGFLVVFFSGLFFLPGERLGGLAVATAGLGLVGQALLAPSYGWVVLWMTVYSWGIHIFLPLQSDIGMKLSADGRFGRRLGQYQGVNTAAVIAGCLLVWYLFAGLKWSYSRSFLFAAVFAFAAAVSLLLMRPRRDGTQKTRFVLKRRYTRFYLLNILWGARKQIFLTFAPWVLVKIYKQPPTTFATLILVASVAGVILQPMLGRAIDRFGERTIFLWEGWSIIGIYLGYALAGRIFGGRALYVLFLCYTIDRFLMTVSMARATYLRKIVEDPADLTPTLSMGVSIDHFVSMTIPSLGGLLWTYFGYPAVFLAGAAIAVGNLAVAWRLRITRTEPVKGVPGA